MSTDREQRLLEDVRRAGGTLRLTAGELGGRLGIEIIRLTDAYTQHALRARLRGLGLTAEYQASGDSVILHDASGTPAAPTAERPSAAPPQPSGSVGVPPPGTAKEIWSGAYAIATAIANVFPSVAFELVPGGKLEGKSITFVLVYLQTLPLSVAVTGVVLIFARELFDSDQERFAAACGLVIVSSVIGIGLGSSQADLEFLSQVRGNLFAVLVEVAAYALAAYAVVYGFVLWVAGVIAGTVAGLWVHEKLGPA